MTDIEFNKSLRELNIAYRKLFGTIPCISDYSCSREEYREALKKAVEQKQELKAFLPAVVAPQDSNALI